MSSTSPAEWRGLPVTLDRESSMFLDRDQTAFRAVVHGDTHKWAGMMFVSNELMRDSGIDLDGLVVQGLDGIVRPRLYPRIPQFPSIVLFPRWDRFMRGVRYYRYRSRELFRRDDDNDMCDW